MIPLPLFIDPNLNPSARHRIGKGFNEKREGVKWRVLF